MRAFYDKGLAGANEGMKMSPWKCSMVRKLRRSISLGCSCAILIRRNGSDEEAAKISPNHP